MAIGQILVATDFSEASEAALALAVRIARRCGARLTVLHVDAPPPALGLVATDPAYTPPQLFELLHRDHDLRLERDLDDLKTRYGGDVDLTPVLRRADVVDGILGHAQELEADLILLGSRGGGATRFLLGSVASKVARGAHCPLIVAGPRKTTDIRRALVAVDYSRFSRPAAQFAAQLLGSDGRLELMHVWHEPHLAALERTLGERDELTNAVREGREGQMRALRLFAHEMDLPAAASCYVGTGDPPSAIFSRAKQTDADLIVVGAHSRDTVSEYLVGTVADRVLRHAEIPVLLFPEDALSN